MHLDLSISEQTAAWLHDQARLTGEPEASVAAYALERLAAQALVGTKRPAIADDEWMRRFDAITASFTGWGGSADPSRDSIYE